MIDGVTKTPTLTTAQAKYLNYIVEYQNGEPINNKQIVSKGSFVRLKVKLEFRKDITASDLPTQSETLRLSFKVNYVQSDDSGDNVTINNNGKLIKVVSGDYDTVGSEVCIGEECFYVISSDEDSVTMLAKYNLYVGNTVVDSSYTTYMLENPTGIQSSDAIGAQVNSGGNHDYFPWYGTISFSKENYWIDNYSNFPEDIINEDLSYLYVYNSSSSLYEYIENYRLFLEKKGLNINEIRTIKVSELVNLGCDLFQQNCDSAPSWVYLTSYWTGNIYDDKHVFSVYSSAYFSHAGFNVINYRGIRPVIEIFKSEI